MLLDFSGLIVFDTYDWMGDVVEVILGGELYTSVIST
jgi:hypothetical protein